MVLPCCDDLAGTRGPSFSGLHKSDDEGFLSA